MTTRILLVDPNIAFIVGIKQALEGTGEFAVTLSANGAGAEDALNRGQYEVVVMDFDLPDIDVLGLIGRIRIMQSTLPIIVTPNTEDQVARVPLLNIQGSIRKPYLARDLIPAIRSALARTATPIRPRREEFVPPETPPTLRHLERPTQSRPTPSPTDLLDEVEKKKLGGQTPPPAKPGTSPVSPPTPPPVTPRAPSVKPARRDSTKPITRDSTEPLSASELDQPARPLPRQRPRRPSGTVRLHDEVGATDNLPPEAPPPARQKPRHPAGTVRLHDEVGTTDNLPPEAPASAASSQTQPTGSTQQLDDLMHLHGWVDRSSSPVATRPLPLRGDEPPRQPDDTPSVPDYDSPAVRQFLATGQSGPEAEAFGEVLDAVAQTPPRSRSPQDQAFHDLVESLAAPDESAAETTSLDELLASIAQDQAARSAPSGSLPASAANSALDYVLDAIRRGVSPVEPGEAAPPPDFEDTTIGDVMEELFDPAFEQVLAALAGEDLPPEDLIAAEGRADRPELRERDHFAAEDLGFDEEEPAWLAGYEGRADDLPESLPEIRPAGPLIAEPPVGAEDSSRYPATAALNAVTQGEDDDAVSLDQLLQQIERELPPIHPRHPRLKPLPSWEREQDRAGQLEALFDQLEGLARPVPEPFPAEAMPPAPPEIEAEPVPDWPAPAALREPPPLPGDTRPSEAFLQTLRDTPVQETDTRPYGAYLPEPEAAPEWDEPAAPAQDLDRLLVEESAAPAQYAQAGFAQPPEPDDELDLPVSMAELLDGTGLPDDADMQELLAALEAGAAPPPEIEPEFAPSGADVGEEDITTVFYSAVSQTPDYTYQPPAAGPDAAYQPEQYGAEEDAAETGYAPEEAYALEADTSPAAVEYACEEAGQAEEMEEVAGATRSEAEYFSDEAYSAETEDWVDAGLPAAEGELVAMPVEMAARLLGGDTAPEPDTGPDEDESIARIAVQLTQFSLESLAQAILLSRPGRRLAETGSLSPQAMNRLFEIVDQAWGSDQPPAESLMRYIALPDAGDFLLYSVLVEDDMALTMVFHSRTSMRTIRKQARRLSEALAYVPETPPAESGEPLPAVEADAAATLPSRPTDLRPPQGLSEAVQVSLEMVDEQVESAAEVVPPVRPPRPDVPYTAFTCLWLPNDPHRELGGEFAREMAVWIHEIADLNAWEVSRLHVRADHIELTLHIPQKTTPDAALDHLMDDTAQRSAAYYPDLVQDPARLWSDAYYVTTPPRALSERDIARFIDYCQAARQE